MASAAGQSRDLPADVTPVDIKAFLGGEASPEACAQVASNLHKYGIVIVKDPRVSDAENDSFQEMATQYFSRPDPEKQKDVRAEFSFQVGATPAFTEKARNHCARAGAFTPGNRPVTECPPEADPKWRYFWRVGPRPKESKFTELNAAQVIPDGIPEWEDHMNSWGAKMLGAVECIAEMAAVGLGLEKDAFSSRMKEAPHLLAPTGSNLEAYGTVGTVFAKFHYDLNFLTIHGRSRYPGLFIWLRDGTRVQVKVPAGCLLVQAGKQAEYLTGGHLLAGFHEVLVCEDTLTAIEKQKALGNPLWRVSSTTFSHINSDVILEPLGRFSTPEALAKYPPIATGLQVREELAVIKLGVSPAAAAPEPVQA